MLHQLRGEVALCLRTGGGGSRPRDRAGRFRITPRTPWCLAAGLSSKRAKRKKGLPGCARGSTPVARSAPELVTPHSLALLAEACLETGRIEEGLSAVREALAEVEETAARYYEAELNRLEGELLLASKEPDESGAEASFRKAIAIARAQQAKSFELRAATSLARLLARQGRREEARDLLAPDLRLVHRGLRHRRSERGEGAARRVGMSGLSAPPPVWRMTASSALDDPLSGYKYLLRSDLVVPMPVR